MPHSMGDLSFPIRDEPEPPAVETWGLTIGPPEKSQVMFSHQFFTLV